MKKLMLFAGTTEGRKLVYQLESLPLEVFVSVATEYGQELLEGLPANATVLTGRMDKQEIAAVFAREKIGLVVDATHPYATEVTVNIQSAADDTGVSYLRLLRQESSKATCIYVPDMQGAVVALANTQGNVLLTTGSKELAAFAALPNAAQRLYARVLPTVQAIETCEVLGLPHSHIVAMQGPFTQEMNIAMMRQFDIRVLVTKDGGLPGGFAEKMAAAEELGVQTIVVGRPPDAGMDMETVVSRIKQYAEDLP